jgi:hypothetical protein
MLPLNSEKKLVNYVSEIINVYSANYTKTVNTLWTYNAQNFDTELSSYQVYYLFVYFKWALES